MRLLDNKAALTSVRCCQLSARVRLGRADSLKMVVLSERCLFWIVTRPWVNIHPRRSMCDHPGEAVGHCVPGRKEVFEDESS